MDTGDQGFSKKCTVFPETFPRGRVPGLFTPCAQAQGFWQWRDFLCRKASENGKEPLIINLDETRVLRSSPDAKGIVVGKQWWPGDVRPLQSISTKMQRLR